MKLNTDRPRTVPNDHSRCWGSFHDETGRIKYFYDDGSKDYGKPEPKPEIINENNDQRTAVGLSLVDSDNKG